MIKLDISRHSKQERQGIHQKNIHTERDIAMGSQDLRWNWDDGVGWNAWQCGSLALALKHGLMLAIYLDVVIDVADGDRYISHQVVSDDALEILVGRKL